MEDFQLPHLITGGYPVKYGNLMAKMMMNHGNWGYPGTGQFFASSLENMNINHDTGWWYTYPSEKYAKVCWDYEIPNLWKVIKIPWFQSPPTRIL